MSDSNLTASFENQKPLIVIVSNRGPYSFRQNEHGELEQRRGAGGLVTALSAVAEEHDVLWVAAALSKGDHLWAEQHADHAEMVDGTQLYLERIPRAQYQRYYNVIANPLLWFIQHQLWDSPRRPNIDAETWKAWHEGYVKVNYRMAEAVARLVKNAGRPVLIFPQDYHLYLVPKFLRQLLPSDQPIQIQPFIHIPWPGLDAWRTLPQEIRNTILESLLHADRVGFQTQKDAFNFVQTCRFYVDDAHSYGSRNSINYLDRMVGAVSYPISIDVNKVLNLTEEAETRLLKAQLMTMTSDIKRIIRVDRIEPSKNILRGLLAYSAMLEAHPEYRGKVQMIALLVPSRMEVTEYQTYWQEVMMEAGMINARFSDSMWEPVRIIVGDNYRRALAALQIYDVLLVNPITDGMNLVAKEGGLVNQQDGVLLLSEYAGAFYELGEHALVVNPFDVHGTAEAMHEALTMPLVERHRRAEALRQQIQQADVHSWFFRQLDDALKALNASASHSSKASTPETPEATTSEASSTAEGVTSDSTPTARV